MKRNFIQDFRRFFTLLGRRKKAFLGFSVMGSVFGGVSTVLEAYSLQVIIAYFVYHESGLLWKVVAAISLRVIFRAVISQYIRVHRWRIPEYILRDIRISTFSVLQRLPVSFFSSGHSGDILSRINGDIDSLLQAMICVGELIAVLGSIAFSYPYFATLDWRLTLIGIGVGILFAFVSVRFLRPIRTASRDIRKEVSSMTETVTENVTGFSVVKLFSLEGLFTRRFSEGSDRMLKAQLKSGNLEALLGMANIFMWLAGSTIIAVVGALFAKDGSIPVENLVAAVVLVSNTINELNTLGEMPARMQKSFAGTDRLYELLNTSQEPERYPTTAPATDAGILLQNARFSYHKDAEPIIDGLSIRADRGQMIALVGDSGGGKSTVIKLLAGLYPLDSGQMAINGRPLCEYTLDQLRQQIAYVPQDSYIFNGTIRENILYGNPDATEEEMMQAARQANAHDFILAKPDGYDTVVGERGIQLSGGERQRVAIARAILNNAPILLLDEATSSLDSESETLVQAALEILMQGRTSVVVAHRLSTVRQADRIYYILDGKVIQEGNHEDLLICGGAYAELYHKTI